MKITYSADKRSPFRTLYTFEQPNNKGEKISVEFTACAHSLKEKNDIMNLWKRAGFISRTIPTHWSVEVYVTDVYGHCWGRYNPTETDNHKINFNWMLEATEENRQKIMSEVIQRAYQ